MNWMQACRGKVVTAEEAVSHVACGQRLFVSGNCSVPQQLARALAARAPALTGVEIVHVLTFGSEHCVAPDLEGRFRVNTLFIGDNTRNAQSTAKDGLNKPYGDPVCR